VNQESSPGPLMFGLMKFGLVEYSRRIIDPALEMGGFLRDDHFEPNRKMIRWEVGRWFGCSPDARLGYGDIYGWEHIINTQAEHGSIG